MLDQELRRFRVICKNPKQRIKGMKRGEEFEALWPDPWLERRIATHHIEIINDLPLAVEPELTEEV